ncbi:MAG: hypothetical protein Q4A27_03240 [bacterium]|nr:hypothetical protein [bacterium]
MVMLIFTAIIALVLFLSRRKLGIFGLAVFMGIVLSQNWSSELTQAVASLGLNVPQSTLAGIVKLSLILVPAFLLLAKGSKQDNLIIGIISSIGLAIFVGAVSASSLGAIFVFDQLSRTLAAWLANYHSLIIAAVSAWLIFEIASLKFKKPEQKS